MPTRFEILPPALPREVPDFHERQASHCRALAACAPNPALKTRLLREAEAHEEIVHEAIAEADNRAAPAAEARSRPRPARRAFLR